MKLCQHCGGQVPTDAVRLSDDCDSPVFLVGLVSGMIIAVPVLPWLYRILTSY
jgi:hypothetical protein